MRAVISKNNDVLKNFHKPLTSKPLPIGFPTAVTDLPYGNCKIKYDFLLAVGTLKKIVKQLFRKITLNRRGLEKRDYLILRHVEKRSTLGGFKIMIENVHVQFLFL